MQNAEALPSREFDVVGIVRKSGTQQLCRAKFIGEGLRRRSFSLLRPSETGAQNASKLGETGETLEIPKNCTAPRVLQVALDTRHIGVQTVLTVGRVIARAAPRRPHGRHR